MSLGHACLCTKCLNGHIQVFNSEVNRKEELTTRLDGVTSYDAIRNLELHHHRCLLVLNVRMSNLEERGNQMGTHTVCKRKQALRPRRYRKVRKIKSPWGVAAILNLPIDFVFAEIRTTTATCNTQHGKPNMHSVKTLFHTSTLLLTEQQALGVNVFQRLTRAREHTDRNGFLTVFIFTQMSSACQQVG